MKQDVREFIAALLPALLLALWTLLLALGLWATLPAADRQPIWALLQERIETASERLRLAETGEPKPAP